MIDNDFAAVRKIASQSMAGAAIRSVLDITGAALRSSAANRWMQRAGAELGSWAVTDRVRFGAIAVAIAASINLVVLSLTAGYAAPGIPRAVVAMVIAFAIGVAIAAEWFAKAWPASILGSRMSSLFRILQNNDE